MRLHTDLTIYKDSYALLSLAMKAVKNMPRDSKQLIGFKLRDDCGAILDSVREANTVTGADKVRFIDTLHKRLHSVEVFLRFSRDERLVSTGAYADAIKLTQSIGRQAGGWRREALTPVSHRSRPT